MALPSIPTKKCHALQSFCGHYRSVSTRVLESSSTGTSILMTFFEDIVVPVSSTGTG